MIDLVISIILVVFVIAVVVIYNLNSFSGNATFSEGCTLGFDEKTCEDLKKLEEEIKTNKEAYKLKESKDN